MKKIVRTIVVPGRDIMEEDSGSGLATTRPSVYKRGGMSGYCCPVSRPVTGPEALGLGELSESHTIYVNWVRGRHRRTRLSLSTENPKGVRTSI